MAEDFKYLTAEDYAGMDPATMLQVAEREHADNVLNFQMQKEIRNNQFEKVKLEQNEMKLLAEQRSRDVTQFYNNYYKQKNLELADKRTTANVEYLNSLKEGNALTIKEKKLKLSRALANEERFKAMENNTVYVEGYGNMSWGNAAALKAAGIDVRLKSDATVKDLLRDEDTGEMYAVKNNGAVMRLSELDGKAFKSLKSQDRIDNYERNRQIDLRNKLRIPGYTTNVYDDVIKTNPGIDITGNSEMITNKMVMSIGQDVASAYPDINFDYFPDKGFFEVDKNGKAIGKRLAPPPKKVSTFKESVEQTRKNSTAKK